MKPTDLPGSGGALVHHARLRWALTAAVAGVLAAGVLGLPRGTDALPAIARRAVTSAIPRWHTTEPVNAVVYGTRGFDTLGETFLLVAAVVAVTLVARRRLPRPDARIEERIAAQERAEVEVGGGFPEISRAGWAAAREAEQAEEAEEAEGRESGPGQPGARPDQEAYRASELGARGPDPHEGMTAVVQVGTKVMLPVLAMAGLVVVSWGYSPGGGFPAGAVLAGVALLVYASRGLGALGRLAHQDVLEVIEVIAGVAIIGVAVGGIVRAGSVSANFLPLGKVQTIQGGGVLQAFSGLEVFEVAAGLLLVLFAILTMEHDWTEGQDHDQEPTTEPAP